MVYRKILLLNEWLCFILINFVHYKQTLDQRLDTIKIMTQKKTGHIYTVSKLTNQIKSLLEQTYPFIWVTGEISNYSTPASGHSYFTLKDQQSVIQSVMFKNQKRGLKFNLENGQSVFGLARLSVYEPRGSYQLIFEHLEPEGTGSAQIAFEQLKNKLTDKGYFDSQHKKKKVFLPKIVSVITSGTGAAIKDILHISQRRFSNCNLEIIEVQVQGEQSINDICKAIKYVNHQKTSDIIILARGGGSIEDLAAFNSESVANAIFQSQIPIVTGIGHETDYTIADFTADLRAPTPSAAAELVFPEKRNLVYTIEKLEMALKLNMDKSIKKYGFTVHNLLSRLKSPERIIDDYRFRLEDYETRMTNCISQTHHYYKEKLTWLNETLMGYHLDKRINQSRNQIKVLSSMLNQKFKTMHDQHCFRITELVSKLNALNPNAVLNRGYSITRRYDNHNIITNSNDTQKDDIIEIILHQGRLITKVEKIHGQEKNI